MKKYTSDKEYAPRMLMCLTIALLLFLSSINSVFAAAGCVWANGPQQKLIWRINPGAMVVQRDAPVGSVIKVVPLNSSQVGSPLLTCDPTANQKYLMERSSVSGYANYFDTGVPGVGMQVKSPGGYIFNNPAFVWQSGTANVILSGNFSMTFIKTGPITPGPLTQGEIFTWTTMTPVMNATSDLEVANGSITGGSITQVACSVTTSNVSVNLGNILATKFTAVGHTEGDKSFNVGLNCDAGANVNVTLSGRQNQGTSDTSVLGINNSGDAGVASGLGVQILYNGTPLQIGGKVVLKQADGGQESFPFTARYYQTQRAVTVGQANATATMTLTYQ